MIAFSFITIGFFLYYSKSKYFTLFQLGYQKRNLGWVNALLILTGFALYIYHWGWASGILIALAASMLTLSLVQFFVVIAKRFS